MSSPPTIELAPLARRIGSLYSLPSVAAEVLELTETPQVELRAVKECIEKDPALTAKVLRVVNSSLFGLSRTVGDLNHALALLGAGPLKLLVLGFSLPRGLFDGLGGAALGHYWRRTLVKAVAARLFSQRFFQTAGDDAFLAGLLHDIGLLALLQELGDDLAAFWNDARQRQADVAALEREAFGFTHHELSAELLAAWKLPPRLVKVVGLPLDVEAIAALAAPERRLGQALHLAELAAQALVDEQPDAFSSLHATAERYGAASAADLEQWRADLETQVAELADVLSLELPAAGDPRELLARAHRRLGDAVEAAVARGGVSDESLSHTARQLSERLAAVVERGPAPRPAPAASAAPATRSGPSIAAGAHYIGPPPLAEPPILRVPAADDGFDPGLIGRMETALQQARSRHVSVSLVLIEVDRYSDLVLRHGLPEARRLAAQVAAEWAERSPGPVDVLMLDDARFATVLLDVDRRQAVELARELAGALRSWSQQRRRTGGTPLTASVGVGTVVSPSLRFPPRELAAAAQRCLDGALLSGGDCWKSIEL